MLVVGLGNPGWEYEKTRHNVGFRVIDEVCARFRKELSPGKGDYAYALASAGGTDIVLVKPLTFMNNSGVAVVDVLERFGMSPGELLVVSDDFALPLGTLRLREAGSDGGHNGLSSVIYQLGTERFARLRCGIGKESTPAGEEMAEFVLAPFDKEELAAVAEMIPRAADGVIECVTAGIARAMTKVNTG